VEAARPHLESSPVFVVLGGGRAPRDWVRLEELAAGQAASPLSEGDEDTAGAAMIYTSGTTGHPKGSYRPDGVSLEGIVQVIQVFGIRADDVHLMAGPGYHSAVGAFNLLTGVCGGTIVIMPSFDPEQALALIDRHRVTTTFMAPTLLHRIMDLPEQVRARYDVSCMRGLILGAAPCPFSLKERAIAYFGETLFEFYGATETGFNLVLRPEDQLRKPGSAGKAPPGGPIPPLEDPGHPVPGGRPRELLVRESEWGGH